jgi:hypothetical protein
MGPLDRVLSAHLAGPAEQAPTGRPPSNLALGQVASASRCSGSDSGSRCSGSDWRTCVAQLQAARSRRPCEITSQCPRRPTVSGAPEPGPPYYSSPSARSSALSPGAGWASRWPHRCSPSTPRFRSHDDGPARTGSGDAHLRAALPSADRPYRRRSARRRVVYSRAHPSRQPGGLHVAGRLRHRRGGWRCCARRSEVSTSGDHPAWLHAVVGKGPRRQRDP